MKSVIQIAIMVLSSENSMTVVQTPVQYRAFRARSRAPRSVNTDAAQTAN
jgi:hypothetical protein